MSLFKFVGTLKVDLQLQNRVSSLLKFLGNKYHDRSNSELVSDSGAVGGMTDKTVVIPGFFKIECGSGHHIMVVLPGLFACATE